MPHVELPIPSKWIRRIIVVLMILACAGAFALLGQIPTGRTSAATIQEHEKPHAWCYTRGSYETLSCVPKN
jgi:hypothetical protein